MRRVRNFWGSIPRFEHLPPQKKTVNRSIWRDEGVRNKEVSVQFLFFAHPGKNISWNEREMKCGFPFLFQLSLFSQRVCSFYLPDQSQLKLVLKRTEVRTWTIKQTSWPIDWLTERKSTWKWNRRDFCSSFASERQLAFKWNFLSPFSFPAIIIFFRHVRRNNKWVSRRLWLTLNRKPLW